MKNIFKTFGVLFAGVALILSSCEEEVTVFDNVNGQTGVSFGTTSYNVSVPEEGLALEIPVNVTTVSDSDRTIDVTVSDASIGGGENYSFGTVTIPANGYNGVLDVTLNFDPLVDGEVYALVLNLSALEGGVAFDETVTIEYFKEIICNDFLLTVVTDTYGGETTWEIADESGTVVVSGGPYDNVSGGDTYTSEFFLEDGCYTFTIYDAYGDGQSDGTIVGSYTLECSILDVLTGGGEFSDSQTQEFCVNQ
ncbi:hypothetical protein GUA46_04840 [Muricauda sp. HICW]|uniref:Uncharacterized protein n=1 Tax=Flagellimonas chongwuensis TaxID=2697365 RepID=A0A850NCM6_9FLAO|nr:hypothetical protein [Allomuricauda chongwuensis]NVN17659.1 hypothetical protein [Allomuricauda chongwuensis]